MPKQLKTDYPPGPHLLDGQLLNERARQLNALADWSSPFRSRLLVGQFVVTQDGATCAQSDGWYSAPCGYRNLYVGQQYTWNSQTEAWEVYDDDWHLDAAPLNSARNYSVARLDSGQALSNGETIAAAWDRLRLSAVPLDMPVAYIVRLTADVAHATGTPLTVQQASVKILRRNAATNKLEVATDAGGNAMDPAAFNWYGDDQDFVSGNTFLAARDAFGDLWLMTGDCEEEIESLTSATSQTSTSVSSTSVST